MAGKRGGGAGVAQLDHFRTWNVAACVLHLASALAVILFAPGVSLPITFKGSVVFSFGVRFGLAFMFLGAAASCLLVVTSAAWAAELLHERNPCRLLEFAVGAPLLVTLIVLAGTKQLDVVTWSLVCAANMGMVGFGWLQMLNQGRGGVLQGFWMGAALGVTAWAAVVVLVCQSPIVQGENRAMFQRTHAHAHPSLMVFASSRFLSCLDSTIYRPLSLSLCLSLSSLSCQDPHS
jgi:hypothetical protein